MAFPPFFQRPKGVLLRISILRMLNDEPMHGYQLMKQIEDSTNGAWVPSHSLLYNTLSDLEEQRFVSSKKEYKGEVERTIYSITQAGRTYLKEQVTHMVRMISQMMSTAAVRPFQQMPRLLLEQLEPEERKAFLIQIRDTLKDSLQEVEKDLAKLELQESKL
ncbi:MAG: PadR family transcriptional regulator [Promethearchaeota archaeon]